MKSGAIALVTSTLYKNWYSGIIKRENDIDKIRGDLALKMLSRLKSYKIKAIVVDNGSSDIFINKLNKINVYKLVTNFPGTFGAARREGYKIASKISGIKVIIWTEPEKLNLINNSLIKASEIVANGSADIVIPKRGKRALLSLPPFQKRSEIIGNNSIQKMLRNQINDNLPNFDIFFGPKIFLNKPHVLDLFLQKFEFKKGTNKNNRPSPEQWLNALAFPVVSALIKNYKVKSVGVDYLHPQLQTRIEKGSLYFNKKRLIQRKSLVMGVRELLRYYDNPKKSILES